MTPAQVLYPLISVVEVSVLVQSWLRPSRAQNAAALRLWLITQIAIFGVLEPASFFPCSYAAPFLICSLVSDAADLVVLYSIFQCLEDGSPAFGTVRAWGAMALITGMTFALCAGLPLPVKANGINAAWLMAAQTFVYLRAICLVALSLYGWLRASSWPSDLAWTWFGMALYGVTEAIVQRVQILASDTNLFELVTSAGALLQLAGMWQALNYFPKPLTSEELDGIEHLESPSVEG